MERQTIKSDPATVARLLADHRKRENEAGKPKPPFGTRQYKGGPLARPERACQGGLPSLGEGYS